MPAAPKNSQIAIEKLLTTSTCTGPYATGGNFSKHHSFPKICITEEGITARPLSLPLTDTDVARIIQHGERAGVGLPDKTVVNLDVRKTWQLKPDKILISNFDGTLKHAIDQVSEGLGTSTDYNVSAHLYKLLLYEPGCFFDRHRDNERLDGMFGTLIIELPSIYQGAQLSVWSPLTPSEEKVYGGQGKRRSMTYMAFYADCYHQVSTLTSGHRVALVYHLTAHPKVPKPLGHLPDPPLLPAQPADAGVVQAIADCMYTFAHESNGDYQKDREGSKPSKFAIVLSHHYTPAGLSSAGLDALKGSDRAVGELIRAGAWRRPNQLEPSEHDEEDAPYYDAVLSLAVLWDHGEGSPRGGDDDDEFGNGCGPHGFRTTGPLIPVAGKNVAVPLNMGPALDGDLNAEYDPGWFADDGFFPDEGPEDFQDFAAYEAYEAANDIVMKWPDRYGNHSLPIFSNELLFASEKAKSDYKYHNCYGNENVVAEPKKIEFLGNGMPYPGRCYSRSVILLWPKEHREVIALQSKGGLAVKAKAEEKKPRTKKPKRSGSVH